MASLRTLSAIFILFCSVIHSAMAYSVYYGSWYLYVWIPLVIIAIIRCCCYYNQKKEREAQTVYVDQGGRPTGQAQTVISTQMTAGSTVINPPQYQPALHYGQPQGAVINSAYTPDPAGTAYPPNAPGLPYPPSSPRQPGTAYPPPPQYSEAVKLPEPL
ncbi:rhodopsin-like [Strongylocentrotus purpuratus]|uniref:Vesicular, overexpressed in cancer, prosurvival protein 1 n=1 Tax=Strongylocentrotus purpuratus TaxID=7668 RepID=A0A7M7P799_STRPU|nr:rhodopsin-like [Strongylocentrotus purpuratus]XP_030846477.1 rhodopsin-like [Strongylocentrotus purpuratus]|eukprot:XP_011675834.1 PREDICTED: rhodopsin-like [Strongylocentrotus purpuratus]